MENGGSMLHTQGVSNNPHPGPNQVFNTFHTESVVPVKSLQTGKFKHFLQFFLDKIQQPMK